MQTEKEPKTALLASANGSWRERCAVLMINAGWNVHVTSDGRHAVELIHKHEYDIVVVDNTLTGIEPVEFTLIVTQIASNHPSIYLACEDLPSNKQFWRKCNIAFGGPKDQTLERVKAAAHAE